LCLRAGPRAWIQWSPCAPNDSAAPRLDRGHRSDAGIAHLRQLERLLANLRRLPGIYDVERQFRI
jgi:hypothetical protein